MFKHVIFCHLNLVSLLCLQNVIHYKMCVAKYLVVVVGIVVVCIKLSGTKYVSL